MPSCERLHADHQAHNRSTMNVLTPLQLLGGLSAQAFMRRHWQKKPLWVRQALPDVASPISRADLFRLAQTPGVESRVVQQGPEGWTLHRSPLTRRQIPSVKTPRWTLLVQGLDLHVPAAQDLLQPFRFIPHARLDDLMISYASDGGGVGPHLDAYDVFLIQVHGRRRWRIGPVSSPKLMPNLPLKILRQFKPKEEQVLEPGDMLYLPPGWGHDGMAQGECMTCSVGFRASSDAELASQVLTRVAEAAVESVEEDKASLYADPSQAATPHPGQIPATLQRFVSRAVKRALRDPQTLHTALGETLSEPKPSTWFEPGLPLQGGLAQGAGVALSSRSRMLYDERCVYLNGESFVATGHDALLMRRLADSRQLSARDVARLTQGARCLLDTWCQDGWIAPKS